MANGEPEADGQRALAVLHQFAGYIIDSGDMVRVHGMAQTQAPGQQGHAHHRHVARE